MYNQAYLNNGKSSSMIYYRLNEKVEILISTAFIECKRLSLDSTLWSEYMSQFIVLAHFS